MIARLVLRWLRRAVGFALVLATAFVAVCACDALLVIFYAPASTTRALALHALGGLCARGCGLMLLAAAAFVGLSAIEASFITSEG